MSKRILTYISFFLLCCVLLTACADNLNGTSDNGEHREFKGTLTFNLSTPDASVRTRTVNSAAGATILLKNLWVGVFSTTDGTCIGAKKYDDMNMLLQSGVVFNKLLSVNFVAANENLPLAYIVAVANYDGVTTWTGRELDTILPDDDDHATITWNDIVNLDIDTKSAYAGSKGEDDNANAPFLAGFFQDATSQSQNPKIDQFSYAHVGPTAIYPAAAAEGMDIELGDDSDNDIYVAAGALCLRRLVSHNTVSINMSNGYEVTTVKYKRFNMPRVVYMLQRRTDTNRYSSFEDWQQNSPNRADHYLTKGYYDYDDDTFPYASDEEWQELEINSWDNTEHAEFVFDHFENKHWGFGNLQSQDDREARNTDGTFAALNPDGSTPYNDFASYFMLQMHIINKQTGESADVEYTLHEGFCNDDDGHRAATLADKCRDFGSFRNVNYTYNINISGLSDITTSVTGDEGQPPLNGQSGTIWQMNYANGPSNAAISIDGGTYDYNGKYMSFSSDPDLGFRIYGRDDNGNLIDMCYNMPDAMYEGFSGLWPTGEHTVITDLSSANIPTTLLNEMQIGSANTDYCDVVDFIKGIQNRSINPTDQFSTKFSRYDGTGFASNYMRGLYIFDRNATAKSGYHVAYGAEQYPFEKRGKFIFDKNKIAWDNTFYKTASSLPNVFAITSPVFYGAECSKIDLRWEHDEHVLGYSISVFNDTYIHPTIVVESDQLQQYLQVVNGTTYFIYPLNTAAFPRRASGANNYSFSVTPIVDTSMYEGTETVVIQHNANGDDATSIRVCATKWEISSTRDWVDLNIAIGAKFEVHYRGLHLLSPDHTTDTSYNKFIGKYICLGGTGTVDSRYFSFWASVPGKFEVRCTSHSADTNRPLKVVQMSEDGDQTSKLGEKYKEIYNSDSMMANGTVATYTIPVEPYNGQPTEFRIYAGGSIDYYSIQFIPAN